MKPAEIKALVAKHKDTPEWKFNTLELLLLKATQTLLERQAEVLDRLNPGEEPYDYQFSFNLYPQRDFQAAHDAWIDKRETYDDIHAILNPENET